MSESTNEGETFQYRDATSVDVDGIFALMQQIASEIPVSLDLPERQEIMRGIIAECCGSGDSQVAIDADGKLIGFVLAKPDRLERFLHNDNTLQLPYIGVSTAKRQRGIFGALMAQMMAKGVPLTAMVLHGNQSSMANRLAKIGFAQTKSNDKQVKFKFA